MDYLVYFIGIPLIAITAWVGQWGDTNRYARYYIYTAISLSALVALLTGILMVWLPLITSKQFPDKTILFGWMFLLIGLSSIPILIAPVRRMLAKTVFKDMDPGSAVHTWALYVFITMFIMTLFMITVLYDPELIIASLKDTSLKVMASINAVIFVLFAFIAAGFGVHKKSLKQTAQELGLISVNKRTVLKMAAAGLFLAVFIQIIEGGLLYFVDPSMQEILEKVMQALKTTGTANETFISALIIGITAGIGEEILFRGLVQPVFGIFPTALLFVLIHTHYGPTVLLAELLVLGIILGFIRKKFNTTAAIIVHGSFDFFVILSSLLPY